MPTHAFEIIPVIDVRMGQAVRAEGGVRAAYHPLETPLAPTADPVGVAAAFQALFPFRTLYVADLDGIEGRGADVRLSANLASEWNGEEVWIDDGAKSSVRPEQSSQDSAMPGGTKLTKVVGSEVLSASDLETLRQASVLSLDFRGDVFLGPPALLEEPGLWPSRLIVMTLSRVGVGAGPDLQLIEEMIRRGGDGRRVYAAGGVRTIADVAAVEARGAAGVLVASALHDGQIKAGDLEEIAGF